MAPPCLCTAVTHDVSAVQASMDGPAIPSSSAPHWQPQSLVLHGPGKAWTSPLPAVPPLRRRQPVTTTSLRRRPGVSRRRWRHRGNCLRVGAVEVPLFAPHAGDIVALARVRGASSRRCVEAQAPPAVELSDRSHQYLYIVASGGKSHHLIRGWPRSSNCRGHLGYTLWL